MEIKQLLEKTQSGIMCFQSFSLSMAQTVFRRFLCLTMLTMTGRHIVITEGLTSNVLNSLQTYYGKSERGIVLRNSIAVASPHKILTEQMFMKVGSEI